MTGNNNIQTKNFKLLIEYDGGGYHGWQRQADQPTIQEEIEKALFKITGERIVLIGSGRTDAGVHAMGQVANFRLKTRHNQMVFQKALNSLLLDDIVITDCREVPETFHARFDAIAKTYHYHILNRDIPSAINRRFSWFIRKPLDIKAMKTSLSHIIGLHDFKSFEGAGSPRVHTNREIFHAALEKKEDGRLTFKIEANGFLRFMVRNIVGTLVEVGAGKITPDDFKLILESKDRAKAGPTAPAHGLFLVRVEYPEQNRIQKI